MTKGLKAEQASMEGENVEIVSSKEARIPAEVDNEKVEFTEGMKFMWHGNILEFRKGDVVKVSRELRDVLLTRKCIILKP